MKKSIIVAADSIGLIGNKEQLPWYYSEDLQWFKQMTFGHAVIMGRKTYEMCGELTDRSNIVISRHLSSGDLGMKIAVVNSAENAIRFCEAFYNYIFVIGGAEVYQEFMPIIDDIWLTHIPGQHKGDTYFPVWPLENHGWKVAKSFKQTFPSSDLEFRHYVKE